MNNILRVPLGLSKGDCEAVCKTLAAGNDSYTGAEIWQRLNEAGYLICTKTWLLGLVKADKVVADGVDPGKPV